MALTPKTPTKTESKQDRAANAEQDALLREVDEAVRADTFEGIAKNYGIAIVGGAVLVLAAFGGYLWWSNNQQSQREAVSEQLVRGIDQVEGNADPSDALGTVEADGGDAQKAAAAMLRAAAAQQANNTQEAVALFDQVAQDGNAPPAFRDAATIRSVAANFDTLKPAAIIERLAPLAKPGNPWFGSAAEMTAMAYLAQNKPAQAGPLLVAIAREDTLPQTLRQRARQLAGTIGFDAVDDVEEIISGLGVPSDTAPPAAAAAPAQ